MEGSGGGGAFVERGIGRVPNAEEEIVPAEGLVVLTPSENGNLTLHHRP